MAEGGMSAFNAGLDIDDIDIVIEDNRADYDVSLDIQDIRSQVAQDQASVIDKINKLEHKIEAVKDDITNKLESVVSDKLEVVVKDNNTAILESFKHLIASEITQAIQATQTSQAIQATLCFSINYKIFQKVFLL